MTHRRSIPGNRLHRAANRLLCLLGGGLGYGGIELLYRGYTHLSMILTGGVCFLLLVRLSRVEGRGLLCLSIAGGSCITGVELLVGCVVNLWMGLDVWDYSQEILHLWGQVCPKFFAYWCGLCLLVIPACRGLRLAAGALALRLAERRPAPVEPERLPSTLR